MSGFVVVKNRNRRNLPLQMLVLLGATDDRASEGGNTGQGFGTKYSAASCLANGLRYVRSSEDVKGRYVAEYKAKAISIEGRDVPRHQIYLDVKRSVGSEVVETSMLTEMVGNAWADQVLGLGYAIMREVILDASDEDDDYTVEFADSIDFAPRGETWTYISAADKMPDGSDGPAEIAREFQYFFKSRDRLTRIGPRVLVSNASSVNEVRIFLTAQRTKVGYVAYSSGDGVPTPVFDYVIEESKDEKLASVPDRVVRSSDKAFTIIYEAFQKADAAMLSQIFGGVLNNSWESRFHWMVSNWKWDKDIVREALKAVTGGRPVHNNDGDLFAREAHYQKVRYVVLPDTLYQLAEYVGMTLLKDCLNVVDPEKEVLRSPSREESNLIGRAVAALATRGISSKGHIFMVIDGGKAGERTMGLHDPQYGGKDVIALHLERIKRYLEGPTEENKIAQVIVHELAHHEDAFGYGDDYHSAEFMDALARIAVSGLS